MRPKSITALCSFLFVFQGLALLGSVYGLMLTLGFTEIGVVEGEKNITNAVSALTIPVALYGLTTNILILLSLYGLWKMQRWGVYLFGAIILLGLFITFVISPPWVVSIETWWVPIIIPVIYAVVILPNWAQISATKNT